MSIRDEITKELGLIDDRCARIPDLARERAEVESPVVGEDEDDDAQMCFDLLRNINGALQLILNSV